MKAIVIGTGTVGSAVKKALEEAGHEVVSVGRKSGHFQADISDPNSLRGCLKSPANSKFTEYGIGFILALRKLK